ncbi:MAG: phage tail protein [Oceanicaulis sp.]
MKKHVFTALLMASAATAPALAQDAFIGQIKPFANTYCPYQYADATGQLLSIASNTALYSLYGTTFGGDGRTTFALPNLQDRYAVGRGTGPGLDPVTVGQMYGTSTHTVTISEMPAHSHAFNASSVVATSASPSNATIGTFNTAPAYAAPGTSDVIMDDQSIASQGGGQPLSIQEPYLAMRYCVALQGLFPTRN